MRFEEKENNTKLEYGDYILFENESLGMVIRKDAGCGVLYLHSGIVSSGFDFDRLILLQKHLEVR